jgi:hypothetical protein
MCIELTIQKIHTIENRLAGNAFIAEISQMIFFHPAIKCTSQK